MQTLSLAQAQKIALLSQGLAQTNSARNAYTGSVSALEQMGYVQIDTISVVQRAHHHTLWSRNPKYQPNHLARMVKEKSAFEYWSHAASYLPITDYRYTLPRKTAIKSGEQRHWFTPNTKLMHDVYSRIRSEGPLMAKDFQSSVTKTTGWEAKPTKQALEQLYMQGDLMIAERVGFHKVYDLTERVLPSHIDTTAPTKDEYACYLVNRYLGAHGLGKESEFSYLRKGVQKPVKEAIVRLIENGDIEQVDVNGEAFLLKTISLELLNNRLNRKKAKILSPFDNLVIQRERIKSLFNFDYILECYVPKPKRQYGYFCLPVLWDGRLAARVDCKAHLKASNLEVVSLHIEPWVRRTEPFMEALSDELHAFARFNDCQHFTLP